MRYHSRYLLILFVLTLLCFHKLAFTDGIIARGDTYIYFYPYWAARDAALSNFHLPLWTPNIFMGAPMLADIQVGALYPPNWLTVFLNTPDAIRISILLHMLWMALGTYLLGWYALNLGGWEAMLSAALFTFGGHVGGHVEQINQLQGLAWMPWAFLALHQTLERFSWRERLWAVPRLALVMALQVLCGHTQTVFITGVGLAIYALCYREDPERLRRYHGSTVGDVHVRAVQIHKDPRRRFHPYVLLGISALLALLLALHQLVPTLQLIGLSNRQEGLSQQGAVSFSLSPLVLGRALLPNYDGQLFGEYIAYVGVIGLGLAIIGAIYLWLDKDLGDGKRSRRLVLPWIVLAIVGLVLALGAYNPLYWGLAALPGFNFFRVPARWMALFALAAAMLAGGGWQMLLYNKRPQWRVLLLIGAVIGGLCGLAFLTPYAPEASYVPGLSAPSLKSIVGWGIAALALLGLLAFNSWWRHKYPARETWKFPRLRIPLYALLALALLELLITASAQPYNDLSAPDAYDSQRFTVSQLQAFNADELVPGRMLSISDLLFDPGDRAALEARYQALGMSEAAIRNSFIDIKMNEILSPNQPLRYGIPTVDGFGGGLVPTAYYTWFASLLTPDGRPAVDGRLREILALPEDCRGGCIPELRWLDLMGVRYLIVDKVYDFWQDGVAYDTAFEVTIASAESYTPLYPTNFEATALDVLYAGDVPQLVVDGETLTGEALRPLDASAPSLENFQLVRFTFDAPRTTDFGTLQAQGDTRIRALTLVDTRVVEVFQQIPADNQWRLALSSDVKVYERVTPAPRAFVVADILTVPDDDGSVNAALQLMDTPDFDPMTTAVLAADDLTLSEATDIESTVTITRYEAERIEIEVELSREGYLVLTDAWYPGWHATVNGVETPIYRADVMFRAVAIPAGTSSIVFTFSPTSYPIVPIISGVVLLMVVAVIVWDLRQRRRMRRKS